MRGGLVFIVISLFDYVCFFEQKTAYEMLISDWSSDVCSSDLQQHGAHRPRADAGEFEDAVSREWSHRWSPFQFPAFRRRPSVAGRSAERRVGKECVSTCSSPW